MKLHIDTKTLKEAPMNRQEYNDYRGCELPNAYLPFPCMTFGGALVMLKQGHKVTRAGWNGKGMFIYHVPENHYPASNNAHGTMLGEFPDDMVPYREYLAMKTAQGDIVPWVASQTDVLAEDWGVVQA